MKPSVFNSEFDPDFDRAQAYSFPWLRDAFKEAKTEVHILIVTDGNISFKQSEFGLSEFVANGITSKVDPWMDLKVVKAHRASDLGEDIPNFRFDKIPDPPHNNPLDYYDEIWLFGRESEKLSNGEPNPNMLSPTEIMALANFMNSGRGLFATGDHEDLGAALCGNIPRVRNMRKWFLSDRPPGRDTVDRLDTLREGFDQGFLMNDQSDRIPQEIRPIFKLNPDGESSTPHEILRTRGQLAIQVLPDHMHEGECTIPTNLKQVIELADGSKFDEYPGNDQTRLSPEIVALSTSVGGFVPDIPKAGDPVIPRMFPIIVAYDGHQVNDLKPGAGVGRIVVDSSFHHYLDVNLIGEASGDLLKQGLHDPQGKPTREYKLIKQYYRNMRRWLLPPEKQRHYFLNMLLASRYLSPLAEEIRFVRNPSLHDLLFAGRATYKTISERFSPTDAMQCAFVAAETVATTYRKGMETLLDPWATRATTVSHLLSIFNLRFICDVCLGGAMLGVANRLPENPYEIDRELPDPATRITQIWESVGAQVSDALKTVKTEISSADFKQLTTLLDSW